MQWQCLKSRTAQQDKLVSRQTGIYLLTKPSFVRLCILYINRIPSCKRNPPLARCVYATCKTIAIAYRIILSCISLLISYLVPASMMPCFKICLSNHVPVYCLMLCQLPPPTVALRYYHSMILFYTILQGRNASFLSRRLLHL